MQVTHIVHALPVVLFITTPNVLVGARDLLARQVPTRYRVNSDKAWLSPEPEGRRIARLARGAVLEGRDARDEWIQVTLDGWIYGPSTGASPRPDFDIVVTHAPNENLRATAGGAIVAELAQGFGLKRVGQDSAGRWLHVTRDAWVQRSALTPASSAVATGIVDPRDSAGAAPARTSAPAPDSSRAQPTRMTTLYRAPDGPEAGTVAAETPLRVLSRNGEWTRVQFEGWIKGGELQPAPSGVLIGVTAAELRAEPQRYLGQLLRWRLEFIAIQKSDELRPDIPNGATYVLARGPLPERGFVYVVVPDIKLPTVRALTPLATMQVIARVRNGRSRYLGNPVVDLVSLEGAEGVSP